MEMREHQTDFLNQGRPPGSDEDGSEGGTLEALLQTGGDLLNAGDAAIANALSTDSDAFLAANRQQGGQ
jgi:hypothetical protein